MNNQYCHGGYADKVADRTTELMGEGGPEALVRPPYLPIETKSRYFGSNSSWMGRPNGKCRFKTLQGEGGQAGWAALFCRFAGCNLWSGREEDRQSAICRFCYKDFVGTDGVGGRRFKSADQLADRIEVFWSDQRDRRYVVFTGGEPLLQLDGTLIGAVVARGFEVAMETNGMCEAPSGIDWICVSPKASAALKQISDQELMLVYAQAEAMPERFGTLS